MGANNKFGSERFIFQLGTAGWLMILLGIFLLLGASSAPAQTSPACESLTPTELSELLNIAARKFSTEPLLPTVDHESPVEGSCYLQLFLNLPHNRGLVSVFISPDRRFVTPVLWDLSVKPSEEDEKIALQLRSEEDADQPPVRGPKDAPVTIVMFADFQCPFCANIEEMLTKYEGNNPGTVRIVFRNQPLPIHKWADAAARAGICISKQSSDGFWRFVEYLYSHQKETTSDNLGVQVKKFFELNPAISPIDYSECITGNYPNTRLTKDIEEGKLYHIRSTPTVFINGHRHGGFSSFDEFADFVKAELDVQKSKKGIEKK